MTTINNIKIRITHKFVSDATKQQPIPLIFLADYQANAVNNIVPNLDNWQLEILQVVETHQTITYYSLFDHEARPITSVQANTPHAGRTPTPATANIPGTRGFNPNQVPLTTDIHRHLVHRNALTTNRTFFLNGDPFPFQLD